jgi:hypothetical protein
MPVRELHVHELGPGAVGGGQAAAGVGGAPGRIEHHPRRPCRRIEAGDRPGAEDHGLGPEDLQLRLGGADVEPDRAGDLPACGDQLDDGQVVEEAHLALFRLPGEHLLWLAPAYLNQIRGRPGKACPVNSQRPVGFMEMPQASQSFTGRGLFEELDRQGRIHEARHWLFCSS